MSYRSGSSHNANVHATLWSGLQVSQGLTRSDYTGANKEGSTIGPSVEQLQMLVWGCVGFEIAGQKTSNPAQLSKWWVTKCLPSPVSFLKPTFKDFTWTSLKGLWYPSVFSTSFSHFTPFTFSFLLSFCKRWKKGPLTKPPPIQPQVLFPFLHTDTLTHSLTPVLGTGGRHAV